MMSFEEEVGCLTDAGLLTRRQAEAFVHREIEGTPRWAAAEDMDIATSTLDDYLADAKQKIGAAGNTLRAIEEVRYQAGGPPIDSPHYDRFTGEFGGQFGDADSA